MLRRDAFGFFYWADRVGDTFRWKGENIATTEVEHVLSALPFVSDVCVFGVEIQNYDGRCGMVAMSLTDIDTKSLDEALTSVDWSLFHKECTRNLPIYARPSFIRVMTGALQTTGTFKHQKTVLVKAGFNPTADTDRGSGSNALNEDRLFFYSAKEGTVVNLDVSLYDSIMSGKCRL